MLLLSELVQHLHSMATSAKVFIKIECPSCLTSCVFSSNYRLDINECDATNSTGCDTLATCTNTIGSYTCNCNMGYRGDGKTCEGKHKARQSIFLVSHQRPLLFKLCRMNFHYRFLT